MNAVQFRNISLLFTGLMASFWGYSFWTGTPNTFQWIFGRDRTLLEATGFRYAACGFIAIALMCFSAIYGSDHEKRRTLRCLAPAWVGNVLVILADRALYNPIWFNFLIASFAVGVSTSYIGGFVIAPEKVAIHVNKHIVPDPAVLAEASKTHQA